ncbi:Putative protein tag-278 [Caenorhabditis elegans] [Rhizoctonia solani]|uniref:CHAT domain-containing protein n=1 Tax=Rhizoctonia solani TaxID=456999 RepID=A0A0K6G3R2_9AGAM|nr:Putative protein tag-278 [Caenorhabditis elegans] [Rhizoctonia solani]
MSDDEVWSTTDEETSTDESVPESAIDSGDDSSSYSYVQQGQGDPRMFRHTGCNDPDHVRALDREIREHSKMLSIMLNMLGGFYRDRYLHLKESEDLNQCIQYISQAVLLSSDATVDYSDLEESLELLSVSHHDRFHLSGSLEDLGKEIEYRTRAISLKPEINPDWASTLSHAYSSRYQRLNNLDDLEQAIHYGTLSVSHILDGDPRALAWLDTLNEAYTLRSQSLCTMNEVEKGIKYGTRAVKLTQEGDAKLPWRRMTLSVLYLKAFYHREDLTDLDDCIEWGNLALSIMPEDHPHLSDQINNLAVSYALRFERLRDFDDLQAAMEIGARALLLSSSDYLAQFKTLSNMSCLCLERFEMRGNMADLEEGTEYSARAYSLMTHDLFKIKGWEWETNRLNTLGGLYFARSKHLEDLEDLGCAIESCKLAISLAPDESHPSIALSLYSLGQYTHARWHLLGDDNDLDEDIDYTSRAVSLVGSDRNPYLPIQLQSLGLSHIATFNLQECGNECPTLRRALDYFQQACRTVGPPREKLKSARQWAYHARENDMIEHLDAYQVAMDLIPQVIWLGTTIDKRYSDVEKLSTLAAEASSAAIAARNYEKALEWLEQGRSIVMNQVLMLRSPLDRLRSIDSSLAERLEKVAQDLHQTSSRIQNSSSLSPIRLEPMMGFVTERASQRHHQLAKEYDELVSQVRQLPGFESFLKPKKATELISAADTGPIVIVNSYDCFHCDALIVRPGVPTITHLELSSFTCQKASELDDLVKKSLTQAGARDRGAQRRPTSSTETSDLEQVLAILWEDIVKPVLDALDYKPNPPGSELPHITWYATGDLSSLPLHAAGIYTEPDSCVSDYAISSYVPSITALLSSRSNSTAPAIHQSILAIGQEATPGHTRLPGTMQEITHIKEHAGKSIICAQIDDENATTSAALDAMERHDWVHLACHAHQSVGDPTKSGFFLHDGTLDLASIMRRSFKNKGLAFLSACQTAMGDENLPDETVHLASGMLIAGYPSVIATMWSVWDQDGPFVANKVYEYLLKDGRMDHRESAKALHCAIVELRKGIGYESFERWVPFIHIGS